MEEKIVLTPMMDAENNTLKILFSNNSTMLISSTINLEASGVRLAGDIIIMRNGSIRLYMTWLQETWISPFPDSDVVVTELTLLSIFDPLANEPILQMETFILIGEYPSLTSLYIIVHPNNTYGISSFSRQLFDA